MERNEAVEWIDEPTPHDEELYAIDAPDHPSFFSSPRSQGASGGNPGAKPSNAEQADLPREVALVLTFEGGAELLFAHGLHDQSDDFSVIRCSQIRAALAERTHAVPVSA